jgi:hypothetical protein
MSFALEYALLPSGMRVHSAGREGSRITALGPEARGAQERQAEGAAGGGCPGYLTMRLANRISLKARGDQR